MTKSFTRPMLLALGAVSAAAALFAAGCGGSGKATVPRTANNFVPNGTLVSGRAVSVTAKITPDQAKQTALAAQPGTAGLTELGDENGVAVYEVHITAATGRKYEAKVDATTGRLLSVYADDGSEGTEATGKDPDGASGPNNSGAN